MMILTLPWHLAGLLGSCGPRIAGKPQGYLFNQLRNFRDGRRSYPPMNYLLAYLQDDYDMLHTGRSRDGSLLYPAMPFPAYTKLTRADSDAIFAYLSSLKPIHQRDRLNELRFPYNNRSLLIGWRALYFREGEYEPDPKHDAVWNRGAYLVEGLGHCGTCHTAINALGGSSEDKASPADSFPCRTGMRRR